MNRLFSFLIAIIFVVSVFLINTSPAEAASRVRGYTRSNGTYVQPHYRSNPDSSRFNNYSTRSNYNPYSGKYGTRNSW